MVLSLKMYGKSNVFHSCLYKNVIFVTFSLKKHDFLLFFMEKLFFHCFPIENLFFLIILLATQPHNREAGQKLFFLPPLQVGWEW